MPRPDPQWTQLKRVFSPEAIAELEHDVRVLELTLSTVSADQRRSEAQRLERIKRRVEVLRKLSTVLQWQVIEP